MKAGMGIALAAVLALSAFGTTAAVNAGDGTDVRAKRASCDFGLEEARSFGTSYVTPPIKTRGVSCGKAKRIVKAFHKCRKQQGGANGHCKQRVKGFKCKEGKRSGVKGVTYNADVKCKRGKKLVKHNYTQNL